MSIKEEIHQALAEVQKKLASDQKITEEEKQLLFLSALIEEAA